MARKSEVRNKSEVGESKESKIAGMIAVGMKNDAIMAAFETDDPSLMADDDVRRKGKGKEFPACDKKSRQRLQEQIRSVRHMMANQDEEIDELQEALGTGEMVSIEDVPLRNIGRFSCGIDALDYIYGETEYIYLEGVKRGQKTGKTEKGLPQGFMSVWPGSPGVGKTRLAIATTKSLNKLGHQVNYYNGEAEPSDFRGWCGTDVNPKLFMVRSAEQIRLEQIVADAYKYKPRVIIIDSIQMIAEVEKGNRGMKTVLSRLKLLKNDEAAGRPHIILISQLNKKGELMGSRFIEHMVDFVARVQKIEGRQGQFLFECPRKNRGGPTPRSACFRHANGTIECVSTDSRSQEFNLVQNNVVAGPEPAPIIRPLNVAAEPALAEVARQARENVVAGPNIEQDADAGDED
jgi:KaiC/GvpD/RAD55 family RecA-like ATPase